MIYPNDPEGLFTNITAYLSAFIGYHFCLLMLDNKNQTNKIMKLWIITSLLLGAMVYPLTLLMPLNKKIWSISFVFLTSAVTGLSLTFVTYFVDILGNKYPRYGNIINKIMSPFVWLGRNPLAIFVLMDALAIILIKYIIIDEKSAWGHFYHYVFASWISNPQVASTIFSIFFVLLWTGVAGLLYRFKIFIRL
jgi:predicted acyltransferase